MHAYRGASGELWGNVERVGYGGKITAKSSSLGQGVYIQGMEDEGTRYLDLGMRYAWPATSKWRKQSMSRTTM